MKKNLSTNAIKLMALGLAVTMGSSTALSYTILKNVTEVKAEDSNSQGFTATAVKEDEILKVTVKANDNKVFNLSGGKKFTSFIIKNGDKEVFSLKQGEQKNSLPKFSVKGIGGKGSSDRTGIEITIPISEIKAESLDGSEKQLIITEMVSDNLKYGDFIESQKPVPPVPPTETETPSDEKDNASLYENTLRDEVPQEEVQKPLDFKGNLVVTSSNPLGIDKTAPKVESSFYDKETGEIILNTNEKLAELPEKTLSESNQQDNFTISKKSVSGTETIKIEKVSVLKEKNTQIKLILSQPKEVNLLDDGEYEVKYVQEIEGLKDLAGNKLATSDNAISSFDILLNQAKVEYCTVPTSNERKVIQIKLPNDIGTITNSNAVVDDFKLSNNNIKVLEVSIDDNNKIIELTLDKSLEDLEDLKISYDAKEKDKSVKIGDKPLYLKDLEIYKEIADFTGNISKTETNLKITLNSAKDKKFKLNENKKINSLVIKNGEKEVFSTENTENNLTISGDEKGNIEINIALMDIKQESLTGEETELTISKIISNDIKYGEKGKEVPLNFSNLNLKITSDSNIGIDKISPKIVSSIYDTETGIVILNTSEPLANLEEIDASSSFTITKKTDIGTDNISVDKVFVKEDENTKIKLTLKEPKAGVKLADGEYEVKYLKEIEGLKDLYQNKLNVKEDAISIIDVTKNQNKIVYSNFYSLQKNIINIKFDDNTKEILNKDVLLQDFKLTGESVEDINVENLEIDNSKKIISLILDKPVKNDLDLKLSYVPSSKNNYIKVGEDYLYLKNLNIKELNKTQDKTYAYLDNGNKKIVLNFADEIEQIGELNLDDFKLIGDSLNNVNISNIDVNKATNTIILHLDKSIDNDSDLKISYLDSNKDEQDTIKIDNEVLLLNNLSIKYNDTNNFVEAEINKEKTKIILKFDGKLQKLGNISKDDFILSGDFNNSKILDINFNENQIVLNLDKKISSIENLKISYEDKDLTDANTIKLNNKTLFLNNISVIEEENLTVFNKNGLYTFEKIENGVALVSYLPSNLEMKELKESVFENGVLKTNRGNTYNLIKIGDGKNSLKDITDEALKGHTQYVKEIAPKAFYENSKIKDLEFKEVSKVGEYAFANTNIENVDLGSNINTRILISPDIFNGVSSLNGVKTNEASKDNLKDAIKNSSSKEVNISTNKSKEVIKNKLFSNGSGKSILLASQQISKDIENEISKLDKKLSIDNIKLPKSNKEVKFNDINEGHWAFDSIEELSSKGIIKGLPNGNFNPNGKIKRADIALMITRLLGIDKEVSKLNFNDINKSSYYANSVGLLKEYGISKGDNNNNFNPEKSILRQDAMTMIVRIIENLDIQLNGDTSSLSKFKDFSNIDNYALDSVAKLYNSNIIKGDNGRINPKGQITRAEFSIILDKVYDIIEDKIEGKQESFIEGI